MRPLSQDLRQRIIAARERGAGTGEVCRRFGVSRKSVERFWKQHRLTGDCRPKQIAVTGAPAWKSMTEPYAVDWGAGGSDLERTQNGVWRT